MNRLGSLFYARGHLRTNRCLQIDIKYRKVIIVDKRLQQFAIGILIVLSLLASSASACTCSHHGSDSEVLPRHHHSEMSEAAESHDSHIENTTTCIVSDADCVCEVTASKFVVKSDSIKLNKQVPTLSIEASIPVAVVRQTDMARAEFPKPFYLSDSFCNLAPKRGPPRL